VISIKEGHPLRIASKLLTRVHALASGKPVPSSDLPEPVDQEHAVAKRLVELWRQGEKDAQPHVSWAVLGGERIFRVQIRRVGGALEVV